VAKDFTAGIVQAKNLSHKQKAVFLDRDGTLNKYVGFLRKTDELELLPGVAEAIRRINASGYLAIVITNQPIVARGEVTFDGQPLPKKGFKPVQLIYQHPEKVMNPKWRMKQVLEESWNVQDEDLAQFGIQKSWLTRFPQELSGGELQRFSVLRSLNPNTKFLIADEMTTMLDAITQAQILDTVLKIVKDRKMGFLLVSHDMDLVDTICDDKIYLKDINAAMK